MNKATLFILPLLSFGSMTVSAQKIQEHIDKAAKDPRTAENAAQADVYILDKRKVITNTPQTLQKERVTTRKKKHRSCPKS